MDNLVTLQYKYVISEIADLRWKDLDKSDLTAVATAYYYFSVQFRENLLIAVAMFPDDEKLQHLKAEECGTANLSPWPGVAEPAERMNHDEFMRRTLLLSTLPLEATKMAEQAGHAYLQKSRGYTQDARARSIASYEDGGLEATFRAMLTAPEWDDPALEAFRHFLAEHIRFDSDPEQGHGALSRHLQPDDRVLPMWEDFRDLLICAVPRLAAGVRYAAA
ncbi:MAG: hypothetical protein KGQ26_02060 [Rhodospirillales bacterium]|nr:hypothetical protein [Rhodospirillales bacterium]